MNRQSVSTGTPWEALAGYSRAVRIDNTIYVSGTTASDASGTILYHGDAAAQTRYIIHKIEAALVEAGATLTDIVRTRIYIRRIEDWQAVARIHGEIFAAIRPANTLIRADLIIPDMLVEIEAVAVIE